MTTEHNRPSDPDRMSYFRGETTAAGGDPRPDPGLSAEVAESLRSSGYEILGELGRGGMGIVYLARNISLNRPCALKTFLAGEGNPRAAARLRAEAEAIAQLRHPNVVQIYSVGEAAGLPFLELEYLPGGSLADAPDGTPRTAVEAARLIELVSRAVAEAHRLGIVHRDLKPANVLLTADGEPKVSDFGLAKSLDSDVRLTHSSQIVGTPCYMAPEQAKAGAGEVGPAADVYSLGALLYDLVTGHPPFQAPTVFQTIEMVRSREPVSPRRMQPALPRDLETICLKCLRKEPGRRYDGAEALADDLGRFLNDQPILARPTGAVERAWKLTRRHPAVAALSAALMMTSALAFVLVFWQWRRAEGKAAAEVLAHAEARLAHHEAVEGQAQLAMDHGRALCEKGEVGQGMVWLAHSLGLAAEAREEPLDRAARVNLAEWSARLSRPLARLRIPAQVLDLAFRPDGRALVALGDDGELHCWDTDAWQEAGPSDFAEAHDPGGRLVGPLAFDPSGSGTLVVFDGAGRGLFWDAGGRRRAGTSLVPPARTVVRGVAFAGSGRSLVTCGADGRLRWWDTATGRPTLQAGRQEEPGLSAIAVSPDGLTMVVGADDGRVVRRDLATGEVRGPTLPLGSPVRSVAFCADGRRVFAVTRDGRGHACDPESERVVDLPPEGAAITSLAVSPDGERFATGTEGGTVRLRDATTFHPCGQTFKLICPVRRLAFLPDGKALAVALEDGVIVVWEVPRSGPINSPLAVEGPVRTVSFSRDGTRLMAVGSRGPTWWDVSRGGGQVRQVPVARPWDEGPASDDGTAPLGASAISPDGRMLALALAGDPGGGAGTRIVLLDAETGAMVGEWPGDPYTPAGLAFSPDTQRLLTWGTRPGTSSLREVGAPGPARPLLRALGLTVHHAAFSPDGKTLLLGCRDGKARLWDVASDVEIRSEELPHHAYPITAVAFDPQTPRVVTGCHAGTVRLWDRATGSLLNDVRGNEGEVVAVAFSPDGKTLLTASLDATARFWDVESGRQLGPPLRHPDAVLSLAFHPNGRIVATGTRNGATWLWPAPATPMTGDVRQINRMVRQRTGLRYNERGGPLVDEADVLIGGPRVPF